MKASLRGVSRGDCYVAPTVKDWLALTLRPRDFVPAERDPRVCQRLADEVPSLRWDMRVLLAKDLQRTLLLAAHRRCACLYARTHC